MPAPVATSAFEGLRDLQRFCGENAAEKGFDDLPDRALKLIDQLNSEGDTDLAEFLRAAIDSQTLKLVHDELSEAHEERRSGHPMNYEYTNAVKVGKPEGVPSELADAVIRLLHISQRQKIDLAGVIEGKLAYNASRERMHGRKF